MQQAERTSFLSGANAAFIEELFGRYAADPNAVDDSWRALFDELAAEQPALLREAAGASWAPKQSKVIGVVDADMRPQAANVNLTANGQAVAAAEPAISQEQVRATALDSVRALMMIRAFRIRGHLQASLDPLGLHPKTYHSELDPGTYGFGDGDWDRPIYINGVLGLGDSATLRQIMSRLEKTYCGHIGVEYMHIGDPDQKAWIQERLENIENHTEFTQLGRRTILQRIIEAEHLEKYLHVKFVGTKRFGLDGGESLIPALEQIIKRGGNLGVKEIVLGMPHRGRLNVLTQVMGKPHRALFHEFKGGSANPDAVEPWDEVRTRLNKPVAKRPKP
jgi:2-oxoglutarate dehydrogenase E1 component